MNITIGMIVLNEEQFIEANLRQHYDIADSIVIVEGADRFYPSERVTVDGLSTDRTADIIRNFPDPKQKITFIQHGWTTARDDQAKCELRNRYMEDIREGLLIALDADEFYRHQDLEYIVKKVREGKSYSSWLFPQLHFWRTNKTFIIGGYYDVPHIRFWRVRPGDEYTINHNHPYRNGKSLRSLGCHQISRHIIPASEGKFYIFGPTCYHYGFCKSPEHMRDKNNYYVNRGEDTTRSTTTECRAAWFREDNDLPKGLKLISYGGPLPEVFQ